MVPSRWIVLLGFVGVVSGCPGAALLGTAESATVDAFGKELRARLSEGEVDLDEARAIAWRRARYEVANAKGREGKRGLAGVQSCAVAVGDAFAARAAGKDELAAAAAIVAIEARLVRPLTYARYVTSGDAGWRAVGARSLVLAATDPHDARLAKAGWWRRKLCVDPDAGVRHAALSAAEDAADPADGEVVLEAARLDPEPRVRLAAIAAAGAIATREVVLGLKDVWEQADEAGRLAIVAAWASVMRSGEARASCATLADGAPGGAADHAPRCTAWRTLWRTSEQDTGLPGARAAIALLSHTLASRGAGTVSVVAGQAVGRLERAIDHGSTAVRVAAIGGAPLGSAHLLQAVIEAKDAPDGAVAVAALARLTEVTRLRAAALRALRERAKGTGAVADSAKLALVRAGDAGVAPLLVKDAAAKGAAARAVAGARLAKLGKLRQALPLLADKDVAVRARTACAILGAPVE